MMNRFSRFRINGKNFRKSFIGTLLVGLTVLLNFSPDIYTYVNQWGISRPDNLAKLSWLNPLTPLLQGGVVIAKRYVVTPIEWLNDALYDISIRANTPNTPSNQVVIVGIDDNSLNTYGRWPWSRNITALLVRKIVGDYRAAVLGMDILFPEADKSSGLNVLHKLQTTTFAGDAVFSQKVKELSATLDYDQELAQSLSGNKVVVGYIFDTAYSSGRQCVSNAFEGTICSPDDNHDNLLKGFSGRKGSSWWVGEIGDSLVDTDELELISAFPRPFLKALGLYAPLKSEGVSLGFTNITANEGVVRLVPMVTQFRQEGIYASLPLEVVARYWNAKIHLNFSPTAAPDNRLIIRNSERGIIVPVSVNSQFQARIAFRSLYPISEQNTASDSPHLANLGFRYFSAKDVMEGNIQADDLTGKIVILGVTAQRIKDWRTTPISSEFTGTEIMASTVASILDNTLLTVPDSNKMQSFYLALLLGLVLTIVLPRLPWWGILLTGVLSLMLLVGINVFYIHAILLQALSLGLPIVVVVLTTLFYLIYGYFFETRRIKQMQSLFGQYVPPQLAKKMAESPDTYSMEGRKAYLTIAFSDVRNFTTISEGLEAQVLSQVMNAYFSRMTKIVARYNGTFDKYIGDAMMAFWGAPIDIPDHAKMAVKSALAIAEDLQLLNQEFPAKGWPAMHTGLGINTGPVTVGDMGSVDRKAYTVLGDAVNLASRLEGLTKNYGVEILVGEETYQATHDDFVYREMDRVLPKGKNQPVGIYCPIGEVGAVSEEALNELKTWHQALGLYRAKSWEAAIHLLSTLSAQYPHAHHYAWLINRCKHFIIEPPPTDWQAVTKFDTK